MAELYLVRHGQASYDQADYDQLSPLGVEQAELLGRHFAEQDLAFDGLLTGSQVRHLQTADAICRGLGYPLPAERDPGLNEYDFEQLVEAYRHQNPEAKGRAESDRDSFYRQMKQILLLWCDNLLSGDLPETWEAYLKRITDVQNRIRQSNSRRLLVVSSGGPIAAFTHLVLKTPAATAIELNLQVRNTSYSHYFFNEQNLKLSSFNNVSHLDKAEHRTKITYS